MKRLILSLGMLSILLVGCSVNGAQPLAAGAKQQPPASTNQDAKLEWAFTQPDQKPEKMLISVIDSAKESLDIEIYSLRHPDIVKAIQGAKKRGVAVRIITDKTQAEGKAQNEALKLLGSAGIPMKQNLHSGLMHLKVTIADKKVTTTGSYNYSKTANTTNDEVLMVLRNEAVAKSFSDKF